MARDVIQTFKDVRMKQRKAGRSRSTTPQRREKKPA
jgi:hypothetical protein